MCFIKKYSILYLLLKKETIFCYMPTLYTILKTILETKVFSFANCYGIVFARGGGTAQ